MSISINDILSYHNLGTLKFNDVMHAYGVTGKGIRVWLPQVIENEYWTNVVLANDGIIVQFGNPQRPHKKCIWDSATVITRDRAHGNYPNLLGTYRPVCRCMNGSETIHAKDTLPIAQHITNGNCSLPFFDIDN